MKIIVASYPKTGTKSITETLKHLGISGITRSSGRKYAFMKALTYFQEDVL